MRFYNVSHHVSWRSWWSRRSWWSWLWYHLNLWSVVNSQLRFTVLMKSQYINSHQMLQRSTRLSSSIESPFSPFCPSIPCKKEKKWETKHPVWTRDSEEILILLQCFNTYRRTRETHFSFLPPLSSYTALSCLSFISLMKNKCIDWCQQTFR